MNQLSIERCDLGDLQDIVPLFDEYRQFYGQASNPEDCEKFLSAHLENGTSTLFVARQGGAPCGMAQLFGSYSSVRLRRIWILNDLFVASRARGLGVGTALLERVKQFGEQTGAARIELSTAIDNVAAQRVYEHFGFVKNTVFQNYSLTLTIAD